MAGSASCSVLGACSISEGAEPQEAQRKRNLRRSPSGVSPRAESPVLPPKSDNDDSFAALAEGALVLGDANSGGPRPSVPVSLASSCELRRELRLRDFWSFVANALLGARSEDALCSAFELGGSIDCLGDVVFTRDEITAPFLRSGDLQSLVWHCLLISWLGAGGPDQETYRWLRGENLVQPYDCTDPALVHELYVRVERQVSELGSHAVFHGDSRAVRFRLDAQKQGERVLHSWYEAVPCIVQALGSSEGGGVSPQCLEQKMRSTFFIGELTAKEVFVHLYYARPLVADTTRHVPVGGGARSGARLVWLGETGETSLSSLRGAAEGCAGRGRGTARDGGAWRRGSAPSRASEDAAFVVAIAQTLEWALERLPILRAACREYQSTAPHRHEPPRNMRVAREHLLDIADVEVMLCYYQNYRKLKARYSDRPPPTSVCPRGWTRRRLVGS